ncbi:GNAT family N-acetyltransferase [Rhodoferax sp.]|uniref:GNAT family N-acetyltransferase n=1 Tax=Rhodoferax sp. TaxID=50421 RepID=UPI00283F6EA6|nr:GNAT family N-acetyltransferase [Rhodoferax sp.]MDR3367829.1 GNAT family N-acetyltransferase [Rhodoferax sp.]
MNIRDATAQDAATLAALISAANRDVATQFGLTLENCPKHPSFCTENWVQTDQARGERYFLTEEAAKPIACVAFELATADVAYLNRLSVLPAHRRCGIGARLVQHVIHLARAQGCKSVSIGVIGEHTDLQRWYAKLGFITGETRRFAYLPFSVTYMRLAVPTLDAAISWSGM